VAPPAGAPGAPPGLTTPRAIPPAGSPAAPAPAPPTAESGSGPRRTLPPSLLRRLPQPSQSDAPQQ
jgi:hypothetical protein